MSKRLCVLFVVVLCAGCFFAGRYSVKKSSGVSRIDTIIDTISLPIPYPEHVIDIGEVEVPYPIFIREEQDSVVRLIHDTIYIPIPMQRKVYQTEDYRAVVSGFRPSLDSMTIYRKKEIVYNRNRNFGIGVVGGYGIGRNGLSPYVGIGLYYRIW